MKTKKYYLYLNEEELRIIIRSLVELRNSLIREGRYTDCVDELILKFHNVPAKMPEVS